MLMVTLLGEQAVTDDGAGTVRTRSSRSVALIGYLAAHAGLPQSRQHLAGVFWPDSTDAQALTNLRRELHNLRAVLGGDPSLAVTPRDLCWRDSPTCRVDLRVFLTEAAQAGAGHAAAAIAEYGGDFLPGLYEDWVVELRAEYERRCVQLCDRLARALAGAGDLAGAVEPARRRIRLRPLEEAGYRVLMRLQADLGDRAGAVSTYHHCASVLERELGLEPAPETRATLDRLLAARPGADQARSGAPGRLVGRDAELDTLRAAWRAAAAGRPGLAVVRGDAGVGKTRLLSELATTAGHEGAVVATARAFGAAGRLALAPVADWLRNPAVRASLSTLDPVWRAEVDRLVPGGGNAAPTARAVVDAWQRHRFFEGLARALLGVGRPTLLVLENLQWCDQETLAFVTFCLGLIPDAPVLVAGTLRTGEPDEEPELAGWLARMRTTGDRTEIPLRPLGPADTARLAAAVAGRPLGAADAALLQSTTGGYPLYVVEAARTAADDGSVPTGDLTGLLGNRLAQVPAEARQVAGLAAAVGSDVTLALLVEAGDLEPDTVVRAVDELWRRRILREFRDGYDFSHDLLRDAAYAQVSPARRWLLHRRLADALESLHAGDTDPVSAQLAEQHARGGRPERAVGYYRRAAEIAAGRFAHAEAIRLLRAALAVLATRPAGDGRDALELDLLAELAGPLNARYGYSSPRLRAAMERSVALADRLGRPAATQAALNGLWSTQFVQGDLDGAQATADRSLALAEPGTYYFGLSEFAFAGVAASRGRPAAAARHFALAADLIRGAPALAVGTRPDVHRLAWSAHPHWLLGHDAEAAAAARDAIALARAVDEPYSLAVALGYGAITQQLRGDLDALAELVAELRGLCEKYGFAYYREWAMVLDGWHRGDLALARDGVETLKAAGSFARMPYWLSLLADATAAAGDRRTAAAILDAALAGGQARGDVWWLPEVLRMRAALAPGGDPARLAAAAELARAHGSTALLRRCEADLAVRR
jgi:DNA-binding SARP family transcriptional activator